MFFIDNDAVENKKELKIINIFLNFIFIIIILSIAIFLTQNLIKLLILEENINNINNNSQHAVVSQFGF